LKFDTINLATTDHLDRRVVVAVMTAVLLLLLAFTGCNLVQGARYYRQKADYEKKIARVRGTAVEAKTVEVDPLIVKDLPARVKFTNRVIVEDRFPWIQVLDIVEEAIPGEVVIQQFSPSGDFRNLVLKGSTPDVNDLVRFHQALESSGIFEYVNLRTISLEQPGDRRAEAGSPGGIQFEVEGRFRFDALFSGPDADVIEATLAREKK
jgi:Tfp pilus assembly protein PilN